MTNCIHCKKQLIDAVDLDGNELVLVEDKTLYGRTYGHVGDTKKHGKSFEIVRPLLGARQLHDPACGKGEM